MIKLDCNNQIFKLSAIKGPSFPCDKDKIKTLSGKAPRYTIDPITKCDTFSHWEIPRHLIGEILDRWKDDEIMATGTALEAIGSYHSINSLPDSLPSLPDIDWGTVEPRPHQKKYALLHSSKNKLICSFWLRMGKTFGSLWRIKALNFQKCLLICPANITLRNKWLKDINKILDIKAIQYAGTIKQREKLRESIIEDARFVIVSYALSKELKGFDFDQIICDEAQCCSHSSSKTFKNVHMMIKSHPSAGVQLLTATPVNHKVSDLWALVYLIAPDIAGSKKSWDEEYIEVLTSFPMKTKWGIKKIPLRTRLKNVLKLQQRIAPIFIRVKPDNPTYKDTVEIISLELTERQKHLYTDIKNEVFKEIDAQKGAPQVALQKTLRILQVCEGAFHLDPSWKDSSKLDYARQQIKLAKETGEKIVIWSIFKEGLNILYEEFKDKGGVLINGDVSDKVKSLAMWSFQGTTDQTEIETFNKYAKDEHWKLKPGEASVLFRIMHSSSACGDDLYAATRQIVLSFSWQGNTIMQAMGRIIPIDPEVSEIKTEFVVVDAEKAALKLVLENQKNNIEIVDGKIHNSYGQVNDWLRALRTA